ncbi:MAG TPA: hypothetical protein VM433_12490 [Mycobacteriales bacterium]|nr:hypothetical protein [Mycobacteriales bacterium]
MPTAALAGDVGAEAVDSVRAGGWRVRGRLAGSPFGAAPGPREDVLGYLDVEELLDDARVDAVLLDGSDPDLAALLPALRDTGLLVLLPTPHPLDVEALRAARSVDGPPSGVGLVRRWEPWARTVRAALPLAGGPPLQVTVRGWPRGRAEAAELVDLAGRWCGEVAAVVAAPGPVPAPVLPGGEGVAWSLLTASGATVLVSHEGDGPSVRLSFAAARLAAAPDAVRWDGGALLPLLGLPEAVPPAPRGVAAGLIATAASLAAAIGGGEPRHLGGPGEVATPADLGDLLVAARVLEALRTSARTEQLVPVA